ncbi:MAG: hypothetical protein RBT73_11470, partial [Spirochaetia bacterium]|nr:hypothetical protein [Spirochaetia bacterium]
IAGGDWKILPLGIGTVDTDYYAYSLVSGGAAALYVAVEKNGPAVYKGTAAGTTWTAVPLGSLDGLSLDELYFANNTLFALAHNGTGAAVKYSLHYSNGTAAFASTTLIDLPTALIGVSHDGAADFLASTSTTVYKFTGVAGARSEVTPGSAKTFGGIAADHDNHIHLSTQDGYLYTYSAGAWSTAKTIKAKQALGMVQEVETTPGSGVYRLLIAHASAGYYEYDKATEAVLDGTSSDTAFGTPASSYTTTIYGKAVLAVHSASTGNEILIGLASQGSSTGYALYSNKYASGTWSGWSAE